MSLKLLLSAFAIGALLLNGCQNEKTAMLTGANSLSSLDGGHSCDSSFLNNPCPAPALSADQATLFMEEFESSPAQGQQIPGVCGNAIALSNGENVELDIMLMEPIPVGTVEFWFKPNADFFDENPKTLLGNEGARVHFFVKDGELIFQKNHDNIHYFVKGDFNLDPNNWNLIAGQWGNGFLSLFVNGEQVAAIPHTQGYAPSPRIMTDKSNRIVVGAKNGCCMEALGQFDSMSTSGAFDQLRISNITRYNNAE
ncbi:MAG: LamG-like jellyroll fold domain-containing protein [Fibrobacter sp.]|nr:LamG-like jellyroll fold domain-containing protein [Fibrobacter sp.]